MSAGKADHIARYDPVRSDLKSDLRGRDILRAVIDLRDLFERTRKIFRRDLSCRRKVHSILCIDRCYAIREEIVPPRVSRNLHIIGDILRCDCTAAVRNILVRIAALHRHLCTVIHRIAVLRAYKLIGIRRTCSIGNICLPIVI